MKNKSQQNSFLKIIESSLFQLKEMNLIQEIDDFELAKYSIVLESYLRCDENELQLHMEEMDVTSDLYTISTLRLENLLEKETGTTLKKSWDIALSDSLFSGEAAFALGSTYLKFKNYNKAHKAFIVAYKALTKIEAHKKACKALLNIVVVKSRLTPNKQFIRDYEAVAKKAMLADEKIVQAICHHNISKELLHYNAFELALKNSQMALNLLEDDKGTHHYFETLLNRCHILINLERYDEAYQDYQYALTSKHPRIIEALEVTKCLLEKKDNTKVLKHIEPCWLDKLALQKQSAKFKPTKMESKLIDFLKTCPRDKVEIIDHLYGVDADWESSQNRLRVLLHRFKKRFPGFILEQDEKLYLREKIIASA